MLHIMQNSVNERIKVLRNVLGISQQDLANAIETTVTSISRIEQGHSEPRTSTLQKIAKQYNVSMNWLLKGEGEMLLPGVSIKEEPIENWKDEAYQLQNKYIQQLESQVEFLKTIVQKVVGTSPNFPNGIGFALGSNPVNIVSAA